MKTTIEIAAPLLERAKHLAAREGVTLRELVEAGLRSELDKRRQVQQFVLRDARVSGQGLQPDFQGKAWQQIRDSIYEGRGA